MPERDVAAAGAGAPTSPRLRFVIGGMQKAGTSALAKYLASHPDLALPVRKEAHVFDAQDFDDAADPTRIDARYAGAFGPGTADRMLGDATPIYSLHPTFVERIYRYSPAMRWILLLRHPVARAISQYHMGRRRGTERWPFWPAMLLEPLRLSAHYDDFAPASPLRWASYRLRGDYARLLDIVYSRFPREQVLLLDSHALRVRPHETVERVCGFLGVAMPKPQPYPPVFVGDYAIPKTQGWRWRVLSWLMRRELRAMALRYNIRWRGMKVDW